LHIARLIKRVLIFITVITLVGYLVLQWAYRENTVTQSIEVTIKVATAEGIAQMSEVWSLEVTLVSGALAFPDVAGKKLTLHGEALLVADGSGALLVKYRSPSALLRALYFAFPDGPRTINSSRDLTDWAAKIASAVAPVGAPRNAWPKVYWMKSIDEPASIRELEGASSDDKRGAPKLVSVEFFPASAAPEIGDLRRKLPFFESYQSDGRRFDGKVLEINDYRGPLAGRLRPSHFVWELKEW